MQELLQTIQTATAKVNDELWEHEFDHVFIGKTSQEPKLNPFEVSDWHAESIEAVKKDLQLYPENYTAWFSLCLNNPKF